MGEWAMCGAWTFDGSVVFRTREYMLKMFWVLSTCYKFGFSNYTLEGKQDAGV
jgi:hypothetical protein